MGDYSVPVGDTTANEIAAVMMLYACMCKCKDLQRCRPGDGCWEGWTVEGLFNTLYLLMDRNLEYLEIPAVSHCPLIWFLRVFGPPPFVLFWFLTVPLSDLPTHLRFWHLSVFRLGFLKSVVAAWFVAIFKATRRTSHAGHSCFASAAIL